MYSFALDGKLLPRIAAVSRIRRDLDTAELAGYQRPEALAHIRAIRTYLESATPMMPNGIVVALDSRAAFVPDGRAPAGGVARIGELVVPLDEDVRPGWIVDGQQRSAAIRDAAVKQFPIFVSAFITEDLAEQRAQFILVNSTKPLPRGLIHELLPSTEAPLPVALYRKKIPALLLERLNLDQDSPLRGRIRTPTVPDGTIKDNSVLKMIESSISDGALYYFRDPVTGTGDTEAMLKLLKTFFAAVADIFDDAWQLPPRLSRLTHGVGIVSLGFLMDAIVDDVAPEQPTVERMAAQLNLIAPLCAWSSGHWQLSPSSSRRWNEIQNTSSDIKLLSDHLLGLYRHASANNRTQAA